MSKEFENWTAEELAQNPDLFREVLHNRLQGETTPDSTSETQTRPSWLLRFTGWILLGAAASVAPFIVLIRSSLWFYQSGYGSGWIPLLFGMGITSLLLLSYILLVLRKFTGRWTWHRHLLPVMTGIVLMFCLYGGLYISRTHTKTAQLQQIYTTIHPLMRISVTTATLFDGHLVVTDLARTPEDYRKMGLPPLQHSLHYPQSTGYVHATDLRTLGRAEWKNQLLQLYFYLMGFDTLRHHGTADHLHISLPLPKS
ncbi:MAG: hypothetical protein ACQETE_04315 [Bacteroidota bacterium]